MTVLLSSIWTDDIRQSPTLVVISLSILAFIIAGQFYGTYAAKKRRQKANLELLAWAKQTGFKVKFAEPPREANQQSDSDLQQLIALNCPFLKASVYDKSCMNRTVIWPANDGDAFLTAGRLGFARGLSNPESWFICKLQHEMPTGYFYFPTPGSRSDNFEWKLVRDEPPNTRWRSPEPDQFKVLLAPQFVENLNAQGCLGFRTEGHFIELYFDGGPSPSTWETLLPKVKSIVESLSLRKEER